MKRRLLAFLLATLLLLLPLSVIAETVYSEGYFYYTVSDGSITITGYFGREREVTVPASIAGIPVNAIGPGAFVGTTVEVLYLPNTIMYIAEGATGTARVVFLDGNTTPPPPATPTPNATEPPAETPHPSESTQPSTSANASATPKPSGTAKPSSSATEAEEEDDPFVVIETGGGEVTIVDDTEGASPTPFDTTIHEGNGIVFASAEATAAPQEPEAKPTAQPMEADAKTDVQQTQEPAKPVPTESGNLRPYLWLFVTMGAAVLVGIVAIILLVRLRKRG